ncbi:hypothetical protein AAMO2058_000064900 [Amorphochlora amoebiformis]
MSLYAYLDSVSAKEILKLEDVTVYTVANICYVVFNMRDRSVNVVNMKLFPQFQKVLKLVQEMISRRSVGVVVFSSGKKDTFIAGADIDMLYPTTKASEIESMAKTGQEGFRVIETLGVPTIAAINGPALGAGCELALACTYRVCADHKKVQIGLPEVKLGLLPGGGGTSRLAKIIGLQEALKIILPGGAAKPKKALKIGLVDAVLPGIDDFEGQNLFWHYVTEWAEKKLYGNPGRAYKPNKTWGDYFLNSTMLGNYIVGRQAAQGLDKMARGKYPGPYFALDAAINSIGRNQTDADDYEAKGFGTLGNSSQSKALISLFKMMESSKKFEEKCGGASGISPKKVGIVGAGVMGSQIAVLCAKKGLQVYMRDIKQSVVDKGLKLVRDTFEKRVSRKRMTPKEAKKKINLVQGGVTVDSFRDCDLIIEAAVELMGLKKKIFKQLEKVCSPTCVLATNTSSLSITELASVLENPDRCVGIHFFNPVGKMPLVEVIRCEATSPNSIATGYRFALQLGKVPVVCNDCPGFVVNRILGIYMGEAVKLAIEGCALPSVDAALLDFGMPMGPFRLMDEVGLDVAAHVAPVLEKGLGERYASDPRYLALVKKNTRYLGKKTGSGFYHYNSKGKQGGLNQPFVSQLQKLIKKTRGNVSARAMADRCVMVMLNEACMILDEKMVDSPADLDLAMVMGTGFAPFSGGLLSYADFRGIDKCVERMRFLAKKCGKRFAPHSMLERMARDGLRFFPDRPDPRQTRLIKSRECPRSRL